MYVIKRDGTKVLFETDKIVNAINKAMVSAYGSIYESDTAEEIAFLIGRKNRDLTVEEIQDLVEEYLMKSEYSEVARAYIRFRYKKEIARTYSNELMEAVAEKLRATNVQNQNANVDEHSFGGRIGEASDVITKKYALEYCLSDMAKNNHLNNEIYIHDLNAYSVGSHNCLSIPFDDLLAKGFNTRQTDVRPAGSVNTAFQLVAVIFQIQSLSQFGGVSATHLDWTMVPYVRKSFWKHFKAGMKYFEEGDAAHFLYQACTEKMPIEPYYNSTVDESIVPIVKTAQYCEKAYNYAMDMTEREVYQAVEGMYHNLNTLQSRSGNQLPFTSINFGTCTLPEGRMVIRALLETSINGIGKNKRTSIFPCTIFQCMKGVNRKPGDPNYDLYQLALKSTAQRLYPNYANVDWSGNAGYDINDPRTYFSTMGCRTANGYDVNGLGQLKDGRGNICPVTIIMPTLAMKAASDLFDCKYANDKAKEIGEQMIVSKFLQLLDQKIHEAKDMLIERFEWIASQSPDAAKFMYENGLMAGYVPEEGICSALKHGTLAIGNLGLAETLQILIGCDHTEEKGMELAKRIYDLFKRRCAEFKEEYKLNFGVYNTPAENLCHTAMKKFKEQYGIIPNVSDKDYFTNSMHVPVWHEISPFEKIDIESQLTGYSSAGCITYVELDAGVKNNIDALETLVNYAMDNDIPYFAINVPNDQCSDCGYIDEINDSCPMCESEDIRRLRRVTGYLTGDYKTAFNKGKIAEVEDRVKHR